MSLKIEVLLGKNGNPPVLILDDSEMYPIKDIVYQGETDVLYASFNQSFILKEGVLWFLDIFGYPHYLTTFKEDLLPLSQEDKWKGRTSRLQEKNELKKLPPWVWKDIPEKDWPNWMLN
jgi:hypothetical protein